MHRKDGTCYLCAKLYGGDDWHYSYTEEHHVCFGDFGVGRKLSERFGLKVYLCLEHHKGNESPHKNEQIRRMLCVDAQTRFEEKYPNLDFRTIFGKNWKVEEEESEQEFGFMPLEGETI